LAENRGQVSASLRRRLLVQQAVSRWLKDCGGRCHGQPGFNLAPDKQDFDCCSFPGWPNSFPSQMPITKKSSADIIELFVAGRVDGPAANELEIAVLDATRSGAKLVYVNLAEATFLCSAGLRVLLQYWRQMKNGGKALWVANPSPEVDSVLTMTGFRAQMVEGAQPGPA